MKSLGAVLPKRSRVSAEAPAPPRPARAVECAGCGDQGVRWELAEEVPRGRWYMPAGIVQRSIRDPRLVLVNCDTCPPRRQLARHLTGILPPVDIAESTVTIDHICKGRFILGVGLGYRECELEAAGATRKDRVPRLKESLDLMKLLWSGEEVDFEEGVESILYRADPGGDLCTF